MKKIQIDGGDGCVEPSRRDDRRRHLPAVAFALHLRQHRQAGDEPGAGVVRRLLPVGRGIAAVTDADYVAIPQERLDASRQAWAAASGGGRERVATG